MKEKDKVKVLNCKHKKLGIKKGEIGEVFLVDNMEQKAFVIFFDNEGYCHRGETFDFKELEVVEVFDDSAIWLELLGDGTSNFKPQNS